MYLPGYIKTLSLPCFAILSHSERIAEGYLKVMKFYNIPSSCCWTCGSEYPSVWSYISLSLPESPDICSQLKTVCDKQLESQDFLKSILIEHLVYCRLF